MSHRRPLSEPIAIVGSSCRFAGGVTSPAKLWKLLSNPVDLSKEVPATRFNASSFYHPNGEYHGTTNSVSGYWLEQDHRVFDAQFFNITPKEAEAIDPQQRILLEVVYEALESAGCTLQTWAGRNVAVFSGLMTADYETLAQRDDMFASQYYATGNARSILSNRISYFFDFHGASMTIDTACSASLVALHQAVHSLRSGETEAAIITGANLMLTPEQFITEASLHMLSPTGKCHMWDISADGYARGEGVAALFLKPLSRALADGDAIQAIVRETGVNSDGRTQGITMPNPIAQSSLIADTYRKAGLDPKSAVDRCQYFEAHGTGTPAGDPKEASAINGAFFDGDTKDTSSQTLLVGSVKTVIGHTEGCAGLAGVLKVVQAMKHRCVPPNLHLQQLNPSVEPYYNHLDIPTRPTPWPSVPKGQPLRASVNSFGFGGANAHAILEWYDANLHNHQAVAGTTLVPAPCSISPYPVAAHPVSSGIQLPLVLSANSQASLTAYASQLLDYLTENTSTDPNRLAWSLYKHRTTFPFRVAVPASDILSDLNKMVTRTQIGTRVRSHDGKPKILGIFTGQGAQWATMATGLLKTNSVFSESIHQLERVLETCPDPPSWCLRKELLALDNSRMAEAAISQPLCTAVQIGLVDVVHSLGIRFHAAVGHSSGEIAAAYVAGRLSAKDAILVAYYRGLVAHLAGGSGGSNGAMIATGLSKADAVTLCATDTYRGRASMAASNSSTSTTISGDADAIAEIQAHLEETRVFVTRIRVDTAYHSHHMVAPGEEYLRQLEKLNISAQPQGDTLWLSSVSSYRQVGHPSPSADDLQTRYWVNNMVEPVLFHEALSELLNQFDFDCGIEVGPRSHLKGPASQTMKEIGKPLPYSGILDRKKADPVAFAGFLAFMWQNFGPSSINLEAYIDAAGETHLTRGRRLGLPSYPWDHNLQYYRESRVSRQYHFRSNPVHELLGTRTRDDTPQQMRWRNYLKLDSVPWIEHHKFQGMALLPASAYCVMALDAARIVAGDRPTSMVELQDLEFSNGIALERDAHGVEIMFSLSILPTSGDSCIEASFNIESGPGSGEGQLKHNFSGRLKILLDAPSTNILPHRPATFPETLHANIDTFYQSMIGIGLQYTGPFRALETIDRRFNFASATLQRSHSEDTTSLAVSPATLDSCFQTVFSAFSSPGDRAIWTSFLPIRIERISFNLAAITSNTSGNRLTVDSHITSFQPTTGGSQAQIEADIHIYGESGNMEILVEGLGVGSFALTSPDQDYELYLHTKMEVDPEDGITQSLDMISDVPDALLESGLRVAEFCLRQSHASITFESLKNSLDLSLSHLTPRILHKKEQALDSLWASDTEATVDAFISSSPYFPALAFIRDVGNSLPDVLPGMLPTMMMEAAQIGQFQSQIKQAIHQISHRYPRMNVLTLTNPEHGLTNPIFEGLDRSFLSLKVGAKPEENLEHVLPSAHALRHKVGINQLDLDQDLETEDQDFYDLAIVSTTAVDQPQYLKKVRQMMRPGGFLLLCHISRIPLKDRIRRFAGIPNRHDEPLTPPDWPDALDTSGFVPVGRASDQHSGSGLSLIIRQAESNDKHILSKPLELAGIVGEKLLVIGGQSPKTAALYRDLHSLLSNHIGCIETTPSIDEVNTTTLEDSPAVLMLEDLDSPLMTTMSAERLELFRGMFKPKTIILWLTLNGRHNPDHAATMGLTRSIIAEIPSLSLQILDVDSLDCANAIAESFLRLALNPVAADQDTGFLWSTEREIHLENGHRLIPRVLPYEPGNDRVNSVRRVVTHNARTLEDTIQLVLAGTNQKPRVEAHLVTEMYTGSDFHRVAVEYSSTRPIWLDSNVSAYICVGREVDTGRHVLAISDTNSSFVNLPSSSVHEIAASSSKWLDAFLKTLLGMRIAQMADKKSLVLLEPDEMFVQALSQSGMLPGGALKVVHTTATATKASSGATFLHPHASGRDLRRIMSSNEGQVFDFLPSGHKLSKAFKCNTPSTWSYTPAHMVSSPSTARNSTRAQPTAAIPDLTEAKSIATELSSSLHSGVIAGHPDLISVPQLLDLDTSSFPTRGNGVFQILDWRADRNVPCVTAPLVERNLLSADKTYVLVGLTRDLGQSLCSLFAAHGARHMVVASRNPNTELAWVKELAEDGVEVRVERLDITDLDSVHAFRTRLEGELGMPTVAGIVNGAMVLDDRVFAQMDIETWERVLRPKVLGSKNLDMVFDGPEMEFFIMTSSFAATGGHAGQSNYAVANMYMNGLAASRRQRGLPGSAINIGVIYGLGLLHRDQRTGVYNSLEREGYPPISERDIHHMFLESIVSGRPNHSSFPGVKTGPGLDLTCGLSRYDPRSGGVQLHWHRDPRFGHFTVSDDGGNTAADGDEEERRLIEVLRDAGPGDGAVDMLFGRFRSHIHALLHIPENSVTKEHGVSELGVDSLAAVEIRGWIWKHLLVDISVMKILGAQSIERLCREIVDEALKPQLIDVDVNT